MSIIKRRTSVLLMLRFGIYDINIKDGVIEHFAFQILEIPVNSPAAQTNDPSMDPIKE